MSINYRNFFTWEVICMQTMQPSKELSLLFSIKPKHEHQYIISTVTPINLKKKMFHQYHNSTSKL